MKRSRLHFFIVLLTCVTILLVGMPQVRAITMTPAIIVDGIPVAPTSPLLWDNGNILIAIEDLATCVDASCQWNEPGKTVWIQKYGRTILFKISAGEILRNGTPVNAQVPARFVDEVFYVPLRFVAESLGLEVSWDNESFQVRITTGERHLPAEPVKNQAFDALVAYTDKGNLWILDGRDPNALPRQITDSGYAQLVGWSHDGKWLAYKYATKNQYENAFLWVVGADGNGNRPVDSQPIYDDPIWSPTDNTLAYTLWQSSEEGFVPSGAVKHAEITSDEIQINTLIDEEFTVIPSLVWHPDGKSLTISLPRTKEFPPTLKQVSLDGERQNLYILKDKDPIDPAGLYTWAFTDLKWSQDGKYLAYHLRMNSGSLTADVVEIAVLDVENNRIINLNEGLKYPQWLAFSQDMGKLAYIAGAGRDVVINKQLELVDLENGIINDYSEKYFVDTQPVWLGESNELLFCRGPEPDVFMDPDIFPGVMVKGQRIYKLHSDGQIDVITKGPNDTADYYPNPSPEGNEMLFLRLERFDQGSLYLQPTGTPDKAVEILRGIRGNPGYYGNYYPQWISVHWFK